MNALFNGEHKQQKSWTRGYLIDKWWLVDDYNFNHFLGNLSIKILEYEGKYTIDEWWLLDDYTTQSIRD